MFDPPTSVPLILDVYDADTYREMVQSLLDAGQHLLSQRAVDRARIEQLVEDNRQLLGEIRHLRSRLAALGA